jgi:hypothetical protein
MSHRTARQMLTAGGANETVIFSGLWPWLCFAKTL